MDLTCKCRNTDSIADSLKCIAWKGRAIVVGFAGGEIEKVCSSSSFRDSLQLRINLDCPPQLALNLVLLKNISIVGIHWGRYNSVEPERARQVWQELFACVLEGVPLLLVSFA